MIAIFSALEEEVRDLKKGMSIYKTSFQGKIRIYEGKCGNRESLLVLTGMGKESARNAAEMVLTRYSVQSVISTGFGGSLNNRTKTGDIVVYSDLICEASPEAHYPEGRIQADSALIAAASRALKRTNLGYLTGKGISIDRVCVTPEAKYKLGQDFAADAVDMESYWIGQTAASRGLPFLAVRPIFDTVNDDLSILEEITHNSRVSPFKALSYLASHPGQVKKLMDYSRDSKEARKSLAIFIKEFMEEVM